MGLSNRDRQVLQKIVDHCDIIAHTIDLTKYLRDIGAEDVWSSSLIGNISQIGELAKQQLSNETKQRLSTIPWNDIARTRDRFVHHYSSISTETLEEIAKVDVPSVKHEILKFLKREDSASAVKSLNLFGNKGT